MDGVGGVGGGGLLQDSYHYVPPSEVVIQVKHLQTEYIKFEYITVIDE